jgi:succinoglycan biosynthesis transport protein ExoP
MAQYDLNLRDYWRVLRRRKGVVLFVTLAFGALAYLFAQIQKPDPIYQATAVVKFERSTTLVGLLVETISLSSGDNLATQAALVRSFPVLERAAKAIRMIPPETGEEAIKRSSSYLKLLSDLREQVKATPEENTTLIDIAVTAPDPRQAAHIANAVAQAYQEENRLARNRQVREARRFIEEQLAEVGGRLKASEEAITALREQRGVVSPPEETSASLARLNTLETDFEHVRLAQQETVSQIQALQEPRVASGEGPPRIFTDAGDPSIAKLNGALLDLIIERDNLLLTLTPEHPQVRDISARITNVRANLLRELRLKEQALVVRADQLQRQITQLRQGQRIIPELAQQYTQLRREITISENLLMTLRTKLQEVQIKEKEQVEEVSLVRPATEPSAPTNTQQTSGKAVVGLLIGLTIGLVLAFVLESLDTSIGTIQDVETYLGSSVMGLIPNIDLSRDTSLAPADEARDSPLRRMRPFLLSLLSPKSTIAEAYRSLRTNVDFLATEQSLKTLVATSASIMEGKTTTAINLAITMAQIGKRVLLVEADLRRPFVHHAFGIPQDPGLADAIAGNSDWRECTRSMKDLMQGPLGSDPLSAVPNIDKLFIMTSGAPPAHPAEFLNSARMTALIATLRQEFDLVIFDCSPVLPVTDAAILAPKTDGVIIVYRAGRTPRSALRRAKSVLEHVRGKVLGVVLTGVRAEYSPDYEELEYYRYTYASDSGERSRGRRQSRRASIFGGRRHGVNLARTLLLLLFLAGVAAGTWAWYTEWPLETIRQFAQDVIPEPVHSWMAPWIETSPPLEPIPSTPQPRPRRRARNSVPEDLRSSR